MHPCTLPEPSNVHASPMTPVSEQYFAFAPLPDVLHVMFDGQVFWTSSQLTAQPHELSQVTSLHADWTP